ncbi:bifunctional helix-turn-helix transcriptional regulator/GNAT family N-acetyltransferase [Glaciecola sp. KUL10]|uniref:bifunctional helix-turn-helix transcriptional regulator/GNAT family N-acetyltransferase n=1 Tax=Glaciecola sp. (strain KUL10) TaxID=2161813 RepID=UPI000D7875EA|nr:bifunctional helix-turn-helix transcriptional regulator/GNAT family N-acetyltransferase [Glaciecola sp. KUL10]GBL06294.1 MarR family transcriptional regulator [Glaciecola sp. KUL10]
MNTDFLDELKELALGSRLKRLSERLQAQASFIYKSYGLDIQPKWFTLLALLDKRASITIVEASDALGLSQPALTQFSRQLEGQGLVFIRVSDSDSRKRELALSPKGKSQINAMRPIWAAVEQAAIELCSQKSNDFYQSILSFESQLHQSSLIERTHLIYPPKAHLTNYCDAAPLEMLPYQPELADYFESINTEWINKMFVLEEIDKQVLSDPQKHIIDKGGFVFFAKHPALGIVGTCALLNHGDKQFELTKMGVSSHAQGLKVGEKLLQHVISEALKLSPLSLFLLTNKKCEAAIHLYERNGFAHDKQIMENFGANYERCDVAMIFIDN